MSLWKKLLGRDDRNSRRVARERLQLVLVHDRINLSPQLLQMLKDDLLATISRHLDVDQEGVRIDIEQSHRQQRLIVDIPIRPANRTRTSSRR